MIKTVLLNDTTRDVGHLGCRLVIDNLKQLCQKYGFEILCCDKDASHFKEDEVVEKIKNAAVVILNGEGNLHDDAGEIWLKKEES